MSRRQQSKQQRRKCPDFRRPKAGPEKDLSRQKTEPAAHPLRRSRKKIPVLSEQEEPEIIFGARNDEKSFSASIDEAMTDPDVQKILQETLDNQTDTGSGKNSAGFSHYPAPGSELDLHGATGLEAEAQTVTFITAARHKGLQSVRIITGKGLHSKGQAVLPDVVEHTVQALKRQGLVRGFRWEKKEKLKSGALLIFLN